MSHGATKASRRKSCEHPSCPKQPAFSYNGSGVRFCAQHRLDGMVNVRNRRCEGKDCTKEPYFGESGGKARFCATHKPDENMVDVRHRRCEYESCTKQPNYGYEGQRACYCSTHKLESMVDVKHRRCAATNCRGYSSFSFPGSKEKYCVDHKREGMVPSGRSRPSITSSVGTGNSANGGRKVNASGLGNGSHATRTSSIGSVSSTESPRGRDGTSSSSTISAPDIKPQERPATSFRRIRGRDPQPARSQGRGDAGSSGEDDRGMSTRHGMKNSAEDEHVGSGESRRGLKRCNSSGRSPEKPGAARAMINRLSDVEQGEDWQRGQSSSAKSKTNGIPWAATQHPEQQRRQLPLPVGSSSSSIPHAERQQAYASTRSTATLPRKTADTDAGGDLVHRIPGLDFRAPMSIKSPPSDSMSREMFDGPEARGGVASRKDDLRHDDDDNVPSFRRHGATLSLRNGFPEASRHDPRTQDDARDAPPVAYRNEGNRGRGGGDGHGGGGDGGSGPSDIRDSRGGGYPAALPPPLRQGYNGAGGAPNMGFPRTKARDGGESYGNEPPAPAGGGGGGTWAAVALVNRQLPDVALGKDQSCSSFHPGVRHRPPSAELPSTRWRGPSQRRPSAASSGWPSAHGGESSGGMTTDRGDTRSSGNSWTFPSGRLTRETWPSPPFVYEDQQRVSGGWAWGEERGTSSWARRRSRSPPSERLNPCQALSEMGKNPSVVTLGPRKRLAKYERGSGSLGPTLETLDMSWARAPQDLRVVSGR